MLERQPGSLINGPRGRRLCWSVLDRLHPGPDTSPFWRAGIRPDREELLRVVDTCLPSVDFKPLGDPTSEQVLLGCLAESVDAARYWQDPDELDVALACPRLADALAPVADHIASAPATTWWSDPADVQHQIFVDRREEGSPPPSFQGARIVLGVWREQASAPGRRHRGQWVGGPWWSTPVWSLVADDLKRYGEPTPLLACTSRSRPGLGTVGLLLEEDSFGTPAARCWPVRVRKLIRVAEIDCPKDWVELAEHYGIDVTGQRIAHWSLATGLERRWILPDWSAVAEDYDAVHLTVTGYLTTSGRVLTIGPGSATFFGGWSPDESFWLSDILELAGPSRIAGIGRATS